MKLLFDQNLSPRLVDLVKDIFPDSNHLHPLGLGEAPDEKVREFALLNQFTIVSKDSDYNDLGILHGFPPKVVWIRRGNCSTHAIEQILRKYHRVLISLEMNDDMGILTLI